MVIGKKRGVSDGVIDKQRCQNVHGGLRGATDKSFFYLKKKTEIVFWSRAEA